jgi:hypothetical protein
VEATVWAAKAPPPDAAVRWTSASERSDLGMAEVDRRALAWVDASATAAAEAADAPHRTGRG